MAQGTRQKSRQMNYQSKLLKVSENDQLFQIIGNRCVVSAPVIDKSRVECPCHHFCTQTVGKEVMITN